jgi:hypothetical protein
MPIVMKIHQFKVALEKDPKARYALYLRVTAYSGRSSGDLEKLMDREVIAHRTIAGPGKLDRVYLAVEGGKMSDNRPTIREAIDYARRKGLILSTRDLSQYVRSEVYHHRTNRDAEPTAGELNRLFKLAEGMVLATRESQYLNASQRQSQATTASGKCGRPRSFYPRRGLDLLNDLGWRSANGRWDQPIPFVARRYRVSVSAINRFLDERNPVDPQHLRWRDYGDPAKAYLEYLRQTGQTRFVPKMSKR